MDPQPNTLNKQNLCQVVAWGLTALLNPGGVLKQLLIALALVFG